MKNRKIDIVNNKISGIDCFESRRLRCESRYSSGFHFLENKVGQKTGQIKSELTLKALNKEQSISKALPPYKLLKIYQGEKESFVVVHYYSLSKKKYIRHKIPPHLRGATKTEIAARLQEIYQELSKVIEYRNSHFIYHEQAKGLKIKKDYTLEEAIVGAQQIENLPKGRKMAYSALATIIDKYHTNNLFFRNIVIQAIDDKYLKDFVRYMKLKELAGKTINRHLWSIQAISEWLMREKLLEKKIETTYYHVAAPKNQTEKFRPLTEAEMKQVVTYYKKWDQNNYYLFIMIIHYTCIRPVEIHRLQRKHFDFINRTVYVPWYNSKNGLSKHVQILDPLYELLKRFKIEKLPNDIYLFGSQLKPSVELYQGDYSSTLWARNRDKIGIGKDVQQYAMKHTFNTMYVNNNKKNIDWEWLRRHNRHATVQQTQDYISELTAYHLDQDKHVIVDFTK